MKKTVPLVIIVLLVSTLPGIAQSGLSQEGTRVFAIRPAVSDIDVNGYVDEPAWDDATPISLDYEWMPGDNVKPPVETIALTMSTFILRAVPIS